MNLSDLLKFFHLVEIRAKRKAAGAVSSSYRNVFRGQGLEFAEVREYVRGDDSRLIDWNVSARLGSLHVKQMMEERELDVVVAVQCSRSMDFGTGAQTKFETAAQAAAMLVFSAIHAGDKAGLVLFGGESPAVCIPPRRGMRHGFALLHRLISHPLDGVSSDATPLARFLMHGLRRRSVVFLLGDFLYGEWSSELWEAPARRHDLMVLSILDDTELEGPPRGLHRLQGEGGSSLDVSLGSQGRERYRKMSREKLEKVEGAFRTLGADFLLMRNAPDFEAELHRLFQRRLRLFRGA